MVEWRERGIVQDSDEDADISDDNLETGEQDGDQTEDFPILAADNSERDSSTKIQGVLETPKPGAQFANNCSHDEVDVSAPLLNILKQSAFSTPPELPSQRSNVGDFEDIDELQLEEDGPRDENRLGQATAHAIEDRNEQDNNKTIYVEIYDIPSSPLSEVPSSLQSDDRSTAPQAPPFSGSDPTIQPRGAENRFEELETPSSANFVTDRLEQARLRTFRRRNPIQLHPYLLESEQYRQSLRARGLRPVAIANDGIHNAAETQEGQTVPHFEADADENQSAYDGSSPSIPSSSPIRSPRRDSEHPNGGSDGGELPSLADLLRTPVNDETVPREKRRKLPQFPSKHVSSARTPNGGFRSIVIANPAIYREESAEADLFQTFPSPETAEERRPSLRKRRLKKFRMPKGFNDVQLPTPATSSDTSKLQVEIAPIGIRSDPSSDSEEELATCSSRRPSRQFARQGSTENRASRRTSSVRGESSLSESERIHKASKRIKGVLPASWLRLDQQGQQRKPAPQQTPLQRGTTSNSGPQRGIAQRISSSSRMTEQRLQRNSSKRIEILDDSDSTQSNKSTNSDARPLIRTPNVTATSGPVWTFDNQDVEEEDSIDPMFPTVSRKRKSKSRGKRQLRLVESYDRSKSNLDSAAQMPRSIHRHPERRPSNIARKKAASRFSIVDATRSMPHDSIPDFLRLAARQARTRNDQGRHSPSRKALSLHVREDNVETQRDLKRWKDGRINHLTEYVDASYRAPARRRPLPLGERPSNRQAQLPSPEKQSSSLFTRTGTGNSRRPGLKSPKPTQSRLKAIPLSPVNAAYVQTQMTRHEIDSGRNAAQRPRRKAASSNRPGHLENLQAVDDEQHRESAFQRDLLHLDDRHDHRRNHKQRVSNPMLERYFDEDDRPGEIGGISAPGTETIRYPIRRERKRRPKPLPENNLSLERLTEEGNSPQELVVYPEDDQLPAQQLRLVGLGPFGTKYHNDFGVKPLPAGTYFHQTTFVGSGGLSHALSIGTSNFDITSGCALFHVNGRHFSLGPWMEDTSAELETIFKHVSGLLTRCCEMRENDTAYLSTVVESTACISSALRSVITYFANNLSFLDSVDRSSFSARICQMMVFVLDTIQLAKDATSPFESSPVMARLYVRTMSFLLVCGFENMQISGHPTVPSERSQDAQELFQKIAAAVAESVLVPGLARLKNSVQSLLEQRFREMGIRDDQAELEALVVLHHVLEQAKMPHCGFWDSLNHILLKVPPETYQSVQQFDLTWSRVFCVLPILEVDHFGTAKANLRFGSSFDNWSLVKRLLQRVFDLYSQSSYGHAATINSYIRATLTRCFALINQWGWRKCELMLGVIFDFFATRNFALLYNEDTKGPPAFLERLDESQSQTIEPSDRSFDVFLRLLASGLFNMRSIYPEKKIKNIAWRFVPNHGRKHAKEDDLREDDLDALRNHHNLLCILYWATPASNRIQVDLIRNLVDFQASHSEVCRLNVRAWANLVRFQLSTDEDACAVDPFAAWMNSILTTSLEQHGKARVEAESMIKSMQHETNEKTKGLLEATVASNEKQIESILTMLLASLRPLLDNARSIDTAVRLFETSTISDILLAFNPKHRRFGSIISLALEVYQSFFSLLDKKRSNRINNDTNEDSQDYGELSLFDEIDAVSATNHNARYDNESATDSVHRLLSNSFGAENFFDESLLMKIVDTWARTCHFHVTRSDKDWSYYLDSQSPGSWTQLRDTEQSRKFAPYFLALIVQYDKDAFSDNLASVLSTWLISLVEREAMLKYQHVLTTTLLNTNADHPLLQNLPFAKGKSQVWTITLADLRARRLSLLSSILSNMREGFESAFLKSSTQMGNQRQEFSALLKQLMQAMKKNYLETQPSSSARGAYVEFAQRIVEFLQQYTADICPIDKFFTDSTAFPLPATDPTYVVGRLKNYSLQLGNSSVQKKLATFFQIACERAVVDNQQPYLIGQLLNSVADSFESSAQPQPSLRRFLLDAIFPSYIESALSVDCGWILVMPILETTSKIFDELLYSFSATEQTTCGIITSTITVVFASLLNVTTSILTHSALLQHAHVLSVLTGVFKTLTSALMVVDYLHRTWGTGTTAIDYVASFDTLSDCLLAIIRDNHDSTETLAQASKRLDDFSSMIDNDPAATSSFRDITSFCRREISETLTKSWVKHDGRYYVLRGNSRTEVAVSFEPFEDARNGLVDGLEDFRETVKHLPALATAKSQAEARIGRVHS